MARFQMDPDSFYTFAMLAFFQIMLVTVTWAHSIVLIVTLGLCSFAVAKALWNRGLGNGMDYITKTGIYGK
jgi:hypothetical protein